jgi:phosphatidylinositol glycan class U
MIYVVPICLRLRRDPLLAVLVTLGVIGTWKSYPTLGDIGVWAGLLGCFPEIVTSELVLVPADIDLRHPLFTLTTHLYTSILLPLLHSLWLLSGTGNANFYYAASMVYGLNASLAVVDVLSTGVRMDIKRKVEEHVAWEERYDIVQLTSIET